MNSKVDLFQSYIIHSRWRSVTWGLTLQFIFGLIILRWDTGRSVFDCLGAKITVFLQFADSGSSFVYGSLIQDGIFMFKVLSVIYFFSFITSMLFYLGYMQKLIAKIGWLLQGPFQIFKFWAVKISNFWILFLDLD